MFWISLAGVLCWTCVFVPKPPFRKFDFQKTCLLNESGEHCVLDVRFCPETAFPKIRFPKNMCDVRFCHKIIGCSHVLLFYNDLRKKRPPGCTKMWPFHADFSGCALNARRSAPEITKQQLCALKSRNATHGFAHLLEPRNPIPGQSEQAGSEVCELAILMSSTKARQQTRQRITHSYTKAHKQQQTDLFPSHPNFFWIFKCMLFVGSLFRTQRTFSKFGFVLHIRCPDNMKKRMPEDRWVLACTLSLKVSFNVSVQATLWRKEHISVCFAPKFGHEVDAATQPDYLTLIQTSMH